MPEIDNGSSMPSMAIRAGETIKNVTPSQEVSSHVEEKTSTANKNTKLEIQTETADEAAPQGDTEDFVSGSAKARKLGESRKKLAKSILDGATTNVDARDNFKKLVQEDKDLDRYFQKHFPDQYKSVLSGEEATGSDVEQSTRAKILVEQLQEEKHDAAIDLAIKLKFTENEAEELEDMAEKLVGTRVSGKELDYEASLIRAARIIRPDKAKVGLTVLPSSRGLDNTKDVQTQAKNEELVSKARGVTGYKPDSNNMLKNLDIVDQGYDTKNRRFVLPEQYM